jgi:hypothetical protein
LFETASIEPSMNLAVKPAGTTRLGRRSGVSWIYRRLDEAVEDGGERRALVFLDKVTTFMQLARA